MVANEILKVDEVVKDDLSRIYPHKALLSSDSTRWDGLYFQDHHQSPFEMVEHSCL